MKAIELIVERQHVYIGLDTIDYIVVDDKVCRIHKNDNKDIRIFQQLNAFEDMLPSQQFGRVNRNCIVSYRAIKSIDRMVHMLDGTVLEISTRRLSSIKKEYKKYLENYVESSKSPFNVDESYASMDHIELAISVMELVVEPNGSSIDFIIRYVNDKMSQLLQIPKEDLIDKAIYKDFNWKILKHTFDTCNYVALEGESKVFTEYNYELKKPLKVRCYCPRYGYCGCFMEEVSEDEMEAMMDGKAQSNDALVALQFVKQMPSIFSETKEEYLIVNLKEEATWLYLSKTYPHKELKSIIYQGYVIHFAQRRVFEEDRNYFIDKLMFSNLQTYLANNIKEKFNIRLRTRNNQFHWYEVYICADKEHGCIHISIQDINDTIIAKYLKKQLKFFYEWIVHINIGQSGAMFYDLEYNKEFFVDSYEKQILGPLGTSYEQIVKKLKKQDQYILNQDISCAYLDENKETIVISKEKRKYESIN